MRIVIQILCLSFLFFCYSCSKKAEGTPGPTGPQGPSGSNVASGSPSAVTGYVRMTDQFGQTSSNYDSVQVYTRHADTLIKTVTDASGKFTLPNIYPGTYEIILKKNGYDSFGVNITHSGGHEDKFLGIIPMTESLTTKINNEILTLIDNPSAPADTFKYLQVDISFDGFASTANYERHFTEYFSRSPSVNFQHYDFVSENNIAFANTHLYPIFVSLEAFIASQLHYHQGDTIYMKTYNIPMVNNMTSWFNTATYENMTYPYRGDSSINYFIWPY